ncbi:hypothetical protein G9A89_004951 [Geosiphon pyriformis]|nr:hypothetical protein G9A89_004951 [Geosiphon pyriformis]
MESEKEKEKESEEQKFTYQNLITENLEVETPNLQTQQNLNLENSEIETVNHQRQNNPNSELINQQNLPLIIVIDQPPINPIAKPIQQPLQLPLQQPVQQQPLQQIPQQPNLDSMAYTLIAKLDNFTGEEDNAQNDTQTIQAISYFFKDTANSWYQSLNNKPQDFNAFKMEFLSYFSNNNSINYLVNVFTTMKQEETETIFNQLIHGLCSSILQHVCLLHPGTLQDAVIYAKDFESAESEANHVQAVNLVMNELSELDSKLEKFRNSNCAQNQLCPSLSTNQQWQQETCICHYCVLNSELSIKLSTILNYLPTNDATINLSTTSISTSNLSKPNNLFTTATSNLSATVSSDLSTPTNSNTTPKLTGLCSWNSSTGPTQNLNSQNYLSLLVTPENATSNKPEFNQQTTLTNILPATITENKALDAIFPFEFEKPSATPLFSEAVLEKKPITVMYTDAKVDGHLIKLILDSGSASTDEATKTSIGEIDNFPFEVNGIIILIKVLVMEAMQYQALVDNDWLSKTNATLNWIT